MDVVLGELARHRAMAVVADPVGEVLFERATAHHVEDLHSAADAEQGHPALQGPPRQADIETVPGGSA